MNNLEYYKSFDSKLLEVASSDDYFKYSDLIETFGGCPFDLTFIHLDIILKKYGVDDD